MRKTFKNNGLSIVLTAIFLICLVAQTITGFREHNDELKEKGGQEISVGAYLHSGHFIESTFENWESEFLQMGMFIVLSAFLFQKGSSESNDPDEENEEEEKVSSLPEKKPWPLIKGGAYLAIYKYSLSIAFFILFVASFLLHWYGSLKDYNEQQVLKGKEAVSAMSYLGNNRLWFESFQNWQSEFLAVLSIVVLSIFLRHKGSPQSKKLTDPDEKTGE